MARTTGGETDPRIRTAPGNGSDRTHRDRGAGGSRNHRTTWIGGSAAISDRPVAGRPRCDTARNP
ncbi:MAG: hypothetical protein Q4P23_11060, partial [Micrococcaceae bacterium]|nr:hypothetical protein [Micrococcaceae bacterium]